MKTLLPLILGAGLALIQPCAAAPFEFEETGSLMTGRYSHTVTLLSNGNLLAAGGYNSSSGHLASAELYDLATGTWTVTGSLTTGRDLHTATLLPNGKVLIAGGNDHTFTPLASAELLRPGDRDLDSDRQPRESTLRTHGHIAAKRQGPCRRWCKLSRRTAGQCRALRSIQRHMDYHWQPCNRTRTAYCNFAA